MTLHKLTSSLSLLMSILCLSEPVLAQDVIEEPSQNLKERFDYNFAEQHDRGLYFRSEVGLTYSKSDVIPAPLGYTDDVDQGLRMGYLLTLGVLTHEQLALHLSQWGTVGSRRAHLGVGPGLTYYFDASENFYASANLGGVALVDDAPDLVTFNQWGLGGEVSLGTGWWVSDDWSMGLSFHGGGSHVDLDRDGVLGTEWHSGLRFTLAFN